MTENEYLDLILDTAKSRKLSMAKVIATNLECDPEDLPEGVSQAIAMIAKDLFILGIVEGVDLVKTNPEVLEYED